MRKLVVDTFLTLDGVMQGPGAAEEDPTGGFTHGGWSATYWDDLIDEVKLAWMGRPFDLLLGRKTYEIFAAFWPFVHEPPADILNSARKYVASRTLDRVEWDNSTLLEGDVADAVAGLKAQDGPEIQVHGSGNLIQTLLEHDLVDEIRLMVFPIVLGTGKRLFESGAIPVGLRLTDSKTASTGVIIATYERDGEINYGSFATGEPSKVEIERRQRLAAAG